MTHNETIGMAIKAQIEGLDGMKDKIINSVKSVQDNIDKESTTSSSGVDTELAEVLKKANENPRLKKAMEEFRSSLYGVDNSSADNTKEMFRKQAVKNAETYVKAFHEERMKFERSMGIETGTPTSTSRDAFDKIWGGLNAEANSRIVEDTIKKNPKMQDHMSNIGKYIFFGLLGSTISSVGSFAQNSLMTETGIQTSTALGFNYSSLQGQYTTGTNVQMQNKLRELELQREKYSMIGGAAGTILPMLAALIPGVGLPMASAISLATGPAGSMIGSYMGTSGISEQMKKNIPQEQWNQLMGQFYPLAQARVETYDKYDIAKTRFGARYGNMDIGGAGLGYDGIERMNLAYMSGGVTGKFNRDTFNSQLAFSRAFGLNPQEVMQSNISSRYTGEEVQAPELESRRKLAGMIGMGSRFGDLTGAMNNLAAIMTKVGINPSEHGLMESSLLPFMMYGNTAKGRMGDMGLDTLMGVQNIFNQDQDSAGNAFLFNALKGLHKGSLMDFEIMKQQGVMNPEVLSETLKYAQSYGGSKEGQYFTMKALGIQSPEMAKTFSDNVFGFKKDGYKDGVEGFLKNLEDETKGLAPNSKEMKEKLKELTGIAQDNVSSAEAHHEEMMTLIGQTGKDIQKEVHDSVIAYETLMRQLLPEKKFWDEFNRVISEMPQKMKDNFDSIINNVLGTRSSEINKSMGFTQPEKDFLFNVLRNPDDKIRQDAMELFNQDNNKDLFETGSNYKELMDKANGEGYVMPVEFDDQGKPTRYTLIRNGFHLDKNDPNKQFYMNGSDEMLQMNQNMEETRKAMPGFYERQIQENKIYNNNGGPWKQVGPESSDGTSGGRVHVEATINITPEEIDDGLNDLREKIWTATKAATYPKGPKRTD